MLVTILSKAYIVDIEYPQGICSPIFVVEEFSGLVTPPSVLVFFIIIIIIIIIKDSMSDLSLFFVLKECRQFKQKKSPLFFEVILYNNADNFFTVR